MTNKIIVQIFHAIYYLTCDLNFLLDTEPSGNIEQVALGAKLEEQENRFFGLDAIDQPHDVSVLQDRILEPVFGIHDPKTDSRIHFIGGIRGLEELERSADISGGIAFSMYPTSMEELLRVADAGLLMPPKSTWFEPKLRSGLFIHQF